MSGPLAGIRVLDLSVMISGPLAGSLLADQGADVIKIETPGLGDIMRYLGSNRGGMSGLFALSNRGKRSVTINTKTEEGRALLGELVDSADVLIQNFRPGAAERMGIGWEQVHARNPRLVYVSISGFGASGPYSGKRVYDNIIQGYTGMAMVQADPATGRPQLLRNLVCDKVTSYTAAQAITAALFARERGAEGQHIELAMFDTVLAFLWPDAAMDMALLEDDAKRQAPIGANYSVAEMADGFSTSTPISDSEFRGMCAALGRPEVAEDPRFKTVGDRMSNVPALVATIGEMMAGSKVADYLAGCDEHDVPAAPMQRLEHLPADPQALHNEVFFEREHPSIGRMRETRPAPRFSGTPVQPGIPAPQLGEHTHDVLKELGVDDDRLAALREAGAL